MPTTRKQSRTPARKSQNTDIAVVEKSLLEVAFERITRETLASLEDIEKGVLEDFDSIEQEMTAALDATVETLPSNETWLAYIDKVFDNVEQAATAMADRLKAESTEGDEKVIDGLVVPGSFTTAEVNLAKQLSALHDETHALWAEFVKAGEGVARSITTDSDHSES